MNTERLTKLRDLMLALQASMDRGDQTEREFQINYWAVDFRRAGDPDVVREREFLYELARREVPGTGELREVKCASAACLLGWAATVPEFVDAGLRWQFATSHDAFGGVVLADSDDDDGEPLTDEDAGAEFFELADYQATYLFWPDSYVQDVVREHPELLEEPAWPSGEEKRLRRGWESYVRPRHAAAHIDRVLAGEVA